MRWWRRRWLRKQLMETQQSQAVFNIYCDESRHTSDVSDRYAVIGALCCPRDKKRAIVHDIHLLKQQYSTQGEFGWSKVSPNKLDFYLALQAYFLDQPDLSFRCIVIDRTTLDHDRFNDGDKELGFYKLYYQLLVHWLEPRESYYLYLDWQQNSDRSCFANLREILKRKLSGRAHIVCLEPVDSEKQPLTQLVDLLIGAVGYQWNGRQTSQAKLEFCQQLANGLGKPSLRFSTPKAEPKFNIFPWVGR